MNTPSIAFYILENGSGGQSLSFCCELVEKAVEANQSVYIHTDSAEHANTLDALLWSFKPESFVPHEVYLPGNTLSAPVQIGFGDAPQDSRQVLVNLTSSIPAFYKEFLQLIEIVPADENKQQLARERYRRYRDNGHEIETHKIKVS